MTDLFQYNRRQTTEVNVGSIRMGSNNPIRIQSMATTNTNDTEASVQQAIRIIGWRRAGEVHHAGHT